MKNQFFQAPRPSGNQSKWRAGSKNQRRLVRAAGCTAVMAAMAVGAVAWLGLKATIIKEELSATAKLAPGLKDTISTNRPKEAAATVQQVLAHTAEARQAAEDPLWTIASALPLVGENFSAVAEVARSSDEVARLSLAPLTKVLTSLNWDRLVPSSAPTDLESIRKAAPSISSAAHAVRLSAERLGQINASNLLPQVAEPLREAREQLMSVTGVLDAAADASNIAPVMLGAEGSRNYLLMIQNNAEARASGGIPGALAVLHFDKGKLTLGAQSSASELGSMSPLVAVDDEQKQIYSARIGKYMQDVNLTPDFPTAAATAQGMWQRKTGQHVDGVISIDPVALSYVLSATGPVKVNQPDISAPSSGGLPVELNDKNVVATLLSDVYAQIEQPSLQDAYFAGAAQGIFESLSRGQGSAKRLIDGIARGAQEGRVLLWSSSASEESVLAKYPLSGSITGPGISPAQFGTYFNDGTGAKMDYYVKRTVQLVQECTTDGYANVKVRVTSRNTAPSDAATSLPKYVTGGGVFGVPPGTVQTNIVAYGPVQSNVDSVVADGKKIAFASQSHSGRPVGIVTVALPPGKSSTVDFFFDQIVQHTEPQLSVTPTVQAREEVVLDTLSEECVPAPSSQH